jgi:hypothetical protein
MTVRTLDRLIAAGVFLFAFILYVLTVAPTASFWDPGERIVAAHGLQIPHPPGAPFYMLLGRFFSMFVPTDYVALSVNMVSVVAAAVTVLLTYLIIVRLAAEWKGPRETWAAPERLTAYAGGVIGALALAVSSSFWFNALEAETYATSTFFTALCVWLTLKWLEFARLQDAQLAAGKHHTFGSGAEQWLVMIAYLYGLAIGVHLLSLLSIFFAALIVYFQHFERAEWTPGQQMKGLALAGAVSVAGFFLIFPGVVQLLPQFARDSGAPTLFLLALVAALALGLRYTHRRQLHVPNLILLCVTVVMIGYSSYAVIMIRSAANPPMDQNDPETVDAFISYMAREQYGAVPLLKGPAFDDRAGRVSDREEKAFPRRWSAMPEHEAVYARYDSDWDFFWGYQINHMYLRYFMWQWVGRASDRQGASWDAGLTRTAAIEDPARSPSERAGRNVYYGLPLLLGLFGVVYHFARDWRRALAVAVLFFVTGLGIILYLNQTPLQPRERDYSYAGSFFAFSLWIGLGATGLIELVTDWLRQSGREVRTQLLGGGGMAGLLLLAVPGVMLHQNYGSSDRSGQYVPTDFAYNMLHSVDENAILFTNGDNDTFPLWYLQEVEGIRRDVRVVNLSLMQTQWYVRQLRNQWSRDSAPIPMRLTEEDIDNLRPIAWRSTEVELPVREVSPEVRAAWGNPEEVPAAMSWTVEGRPFSPDFNVMYNNDLVLLAILDGVAAEGWQRPVYFATTTGTDSQLGLGPFLQIEGLALRVTPIRHAGPLERVVPEITLANLERFRFQNLDNPRVYFDENTRSMIDNYRAAVFAPVARQLAHMGLRDQARAMLQRIDAEIPFQVISPSFPSLYMLAEAYSDLGERERVVQMMQHAEPLAIGRLQAAETQHDFQIASQYIGAIRAFYIESNAFEEGSAFSDLIVRATGDPRYHESPDDLRRFYEEQAIRRPRPPQPETEVPADETDPAIVPEV